MIKLIASFVLFKKRISSKWRWAGCFETCHQWALFHMWTTTTIHISTFLLLSWERGWKDGFLCLPQLYRSTFLLSWQYEVERTCFCMCRSYLGSETLEDKHSRVSQTQPTPFHCWTVTWSKQTNADSNTGPRNWTILPAGALPFTLSVVVHCNGKYWHNKMKWLMFFVKFGLHLSQHVTFSLFCGE